MAAPFDATRATAEERKAIIEYGSTWRARMRSTEPADRGAAAAAIRDLYARARLQAPVVEWRESPVAAGAAARFSGAGDHVRGWFMGVEQRFRVDPRWVRATMARLGDTPDYEHFRRGPSQPFRRLLAFEGASAGITRPLDGVVRAPLVTWTPSTPVGPVDSRDVDGAGRLAFGDAWPRVRALLGVAQAGLVIGDAVRSHAQTIARSDVGLVPLTLGQLDAVHPYVAAARDVLGLRLSPHHFAHVDAFLALASSAGPWFALPNVAFVSERPLVCEVDAEGRLHADDGPALVYGDGVVIHAWHGVRVPARVVLDPESITVEEVTSEQNAEVRRVLAERFGLERFVQAPGSTLLHEDETGRLWRRWLVEPRRWGNGGDAVVMVEVLNSTPEPDGSHRTYFLRVPPTMRTARDAVAWTFGLDGAEYRPAVET